MKRREWKRSGDGTMELRRNGPAKRKKEHVVVKGATLSLCGEGVLMARILYMIW